MTGRADGLPQALTAIEALLGQILVTMVTRLVTLWVRQAPAGASG